MTKKSFTPSKLVEAIRAGNLGGVIHLLDQGADLEERDIHGFPGLPLRTACFGGNLGIVRELLKRGANVTAPASDGPDAPARLARRAGHQGIVDLLVEYGARPLAPPPGTVAAATAAALGAASVSSDAAKPPPMTHRDLELLPLDAPLGKAVEETLLPGYSGAETNILTMDLLRFQEDDAAAPLPLRGRLPTDQDDQDKAAPPWSDLLPE